MKRFLRIFVSSCLAGVISLGFAVSYVHAETRITDSAVYQDTVWNKDGGPYILGQSLTVPWGVTLTIGPGTQVVADPSVSPDDLPRIFVDRGSLIVNGKGKARTSFTGIGGISVSNGNASIENADIDGGRGLYFENSIVTIATTTISHTDTGIDINRSAVSVWGSHIKNNYDGINVEYDGPMYQVRKNVPIDIGGIGNALDNGTTTTSVSITGSSITDNEEFDLGNFSWESNDSGGIVHAVGNWWGSPDGPVASFRGNSNPLGGGIIERSPVEYAPWLTSEPPLDLGKDEATCCSSILFIPGIESSRLYRDEPGILGTGIGGGTSTNMLWEPNSNADVSKLYMDTSGSSTDKTVYSGQPIDKALGILDVYGTFMKFLDGLKKQGTVNEWKSFGYDWRKPISEVVAGNEKKATTTESLIATVTDLASRSRTGKITLIAHSNGGLVAKYLVKTLADMGKESLIDSVISVAVPYLGTPQAIRGLLHGDDQSIAYGLITTAANARGLATNMASAYSLLPSREYFNHIFSPTIAFASTTITGLNNGSYPKNVSSYDAQSSFIGNANNGRMNASSSDTSLAIKGNRLLLTAADVLHSIIDPFSWPATIARWAIIGWNQPTASGLVYSEKQSCLNTPFGRKCNTVPIHSATTTIMGDGTVVSPSAAYNAGSPVAIDLKAASKIDKTDISHVNILEASSTETAIWDIVVGSNLLSIENASSSMSGNTSNPATSNTEVLGNLSNIPGVTLSEPNYNNGAPSFLVVSTHSPVDLHVYDKEGNHTGTIPKLAGLNEDIEDGLYTFYETKIPDSSFEQNSSADGNDTYIYLPDDPGEQYSVVVNGDGVGEFTLDIERVRNGSTVDKVEYLGVPVNPLTVATTAVISGGTRIVSGSATSTSIPIVTASTTPILNIDTDGDGTIDSQASSTTKFDPISYLESLKKTISTCAGHLQRGKNIIGRIDRLEDLVRKGKQKQAHAVIGRLDRRIDHVKWKKISDANRQQIMDMVDLFISQYE